MARIIKAQLRPAWPTAAISELPAKNVADELLDCYLRTVESVYRVIHVPSFRRDYEALWISDTRPDPAFLVLVKLILGIGAAAYDEQFSLRATATRWVYEAQTWLAEPHTKHRLTLRGLQIHVLLLFAREIVDVSGDSVYISAGDLLRRAVIMGLHRDPGNLPRKSTLSVELRRRLWNTILELAVQSSLASGGPPLLSLDDFDTKLPSNLDDEQLETEDAVPRPEDQFTQVSLAIALRELLPVRLAYVKFLNDLRSPGTFEETLRLDAALRAAYKVIARKLQCIKSSVDPCSSQFGFQTIDLLIQRYLLAIHVPFFGPAFTQTTFAFSRKVAVEAALKIWHIVRPCGSHEVDQHGVITSSQASNDMTRFAASGAGIYRLAATQASLLIAVELRTQLLEGEGFGPLLIRPDLLAVLRGAAEWNLHCIHVGETGIKGYLLSRLLLAQVNALIDKTNGDEIPRLLVKAAIEAEETAISILETMAGQSQVDENTGAADSIFFGTPSDTDWDMMVSRETRCRL
jgi:hypothetical protein